MADEMELKQAQEVFATICQTLDSLDWKYDADKEKLWLSTGARGEDLPIDLKIKVDAKRYMVTVFSPIPFAVPEDKRLDMAAAVSVANNILADGNFDYDINNGHIFFRMTNCYRGSKLGNELFVYMVMCACKTVDDFNDRFLMLSKGMITMEKFIEIVTG